MDEEIGVVLSLKQKQQMLAGLGEVRAAIQGTGTATEQASQKAPIAASRWQSFQNRIDSMGGSMRRTGRVGGQMFGILVMNSNGALGPIGEVYNRIAGVGTIMEQTQRRAGKWAIGLGAAMTGAGTVLGTIVSKEEASQNALNSAIDAAGGHHEDYRKQIEKNIKTGERYGDTSARTMSALNRLVLATRNPQEAFRLYNSVLQISAARNMDVEQVALLVGRAMHGQARSLQAFGFQLTSTQIQQRSLTSAQKAHASALDQQKRAQQALTDTEARLQDSHKKTGNSALSVASAHLSAQSAIIAYNKAVYEHGPGSTEASMAQERASIAQERYSTALSGVNKQTGLTVSQQITLRNAQQRLFEANAKVTASGNQVAASQAAIAKNGDTADQIIQQTTKYMAGQASAQADTFTGHLHALAATLDDKLAGGGAHVYKFLVEAGPAMMGLGAVIESGFIPKLGRLFLKITGIQKVLDLFAATEALVGEEAVVAGEEVEASSAMMAGPSGMGRMAKFQGALTGVAMAIGAYEVGTRVHGTGGAVAGGLMGALAGMTIGFSVGGPWGAAIGGAIGLIGGLAAHFNAASKEVDRANTAMQNWMTTAYQADNFMIGQAFNQQIIGSLQKSPDQAAALAAGGVNLKMIDATIRSGNAVGGAAGLQLQAAYKAGKISRDQFNKGLQALQALVSNFGATVDNMDNIAQISGKVSQHMTDVAKAANAYITQLYSQPGTAGYTPSTTTPAGTGLGGLLGVPIGPGHARGGPTRRGWAYKVGEAGPETLVMPADGYVIPHGATVSPVSGSADLIGDRELGVVQVVLDRKVLGEAVISHVQDKAARR